jgi:polyisoprenoid-binding protein YceI
MRLPIVLVAAALTVAPAFAADVYVSDPPHTMAYFQTGHLGISWIHGRFKDVDAKITLDRAAKQGSIEAVIKTATVDTGFEARDKHVRSSDYLDVEQFPTMTFKSSKLNFDGDRLVSADGELTLYGNTRPVTLEIPLFRCVPNAARKTEVCGAEARTTIKRADWGVKRGATPPLGDEVRITIQIEAYKQT